MSERHLAAVSRRKTCYCSFCGKEQGEVFLLIAGPVAFICDECVIIAGDVIQAARARVARGEPKEVPRRNMRDLLKDEGPR